MAVSPRSLILDLLSTLRRGAMPVRALVGAAARFGITENNLRVALARLLRSGRVERDERGRYRLGPAAQAVNRRIASWPRAEGRLRRWNGRWVGVLTDRLPRGSRTACRRNQRALRLLGFRSLEPGLEIRPDNLAGGVASVRETLVGLGLDPAAPVVGLGDLDPEREARARACWDAEALVGALREARRAIEASAARLPSLSASEAMVESFERGGAALRTIILDPLLPDLLVPGDERRALVEAMKGYDRLGRAAWRGFLSEHGVVQLRAALDTSQTDRPVAAVGEPRRRVASGGSR